MTDEPSEDRHWVVSPADLTRDSYRLTQVSEELAIQLARVFGGDDEVPPELKSAWFMIHMKLQEAEQELAYIWQRVAHYAPPPPPRRV